MPGATTLDEPAWPLIRATSRHLGRPLADWSIGDALASVFSPEVHRFVTDAFGYDSGLRGLNAGDAIPYLLGAGDPSGQARTPDEGMDCIPRGLASDFERRGGVLHLDHELRRLGLEDGFYRLTFSNGSGVRARRLVLALTAPALRLLASDAPVLDSARASGVLQSVDAWQATKLYLWYEEPWWRDGFEGIRTTTDRPPRKSFYFDDFKRGPAVLLASYTDGLHADPWRLLADGAPGGSPASAAMLAAIERDLRAIHPSADIPPPTGSAFIHWGADPHETGWHYWRAGVNSDEVIPMALQMDPSLELYLCGEAFSRGQGWVEGALETAAEVVRLLMVRSHQG